VQEGNTSEPVARALHEAGRVAAVKLHPYGGIRTALDDLEQGALGAFMKLEPVLRWLTADRPALEVVRTGITTELLGIAVALDDARSPNGSTPRSGCCAAAASWRSWGGGGSPAATRPRPGCWDDPAGTPLDRCRRAVPRRGVHLDPAAQPGRA
jgi:hypothetical protein